MDRRVRLWLALLVAGALAGPPSVSAAAEAEVLNLPPTAQQWADLGKLPDFSGVWLPNPRDQIAQAKTNPPPWQDKPGAVLKFQTDEMQAGRPINFFSNCLPEGMPAWMLISHNAMEFVITPGKIYMLGESDSNRLRRIYTDGRPHPDDPDPTFHGHSIGHWEGDTLVIDTVGIAPQTFLAIGEAQGVPNNGDVHVVERIRLSGPDALDDTLTITAPHVLTKPWVTTRKWTRSRRRDYDIVEGV
ncbi:MAG TPA: hypothetical protein VG960_13915, partial [Caulobacteraceae bacterium]|nr:hypothetical protein [Caulobacteraceae bacterium]